MKSKKHPLHILETNLPHFQSLVSTESDPSRFNGLVVEIQLRMKILLQYITKNGEKVSAQDLAFAFSLLREYITIWELYFKNHPWRPLTESKS